MNNHSPGVALFALALPILHNIVGSMKLSSDEGADDVERVDHVSEIGCSVVTGMLVLGKVPIAELEGYMAVVFQRTPFAKIALEYVGAILETLIYDHQSFERGLKFGEP